MATRVALVACIDATEGPWTLAKGNESGIKIAGLIEGERIELRMRFGGFSEVITYTENGTFPIHQKAIERYRVCKVVSPKVKPASTTVEIVLNGIS